MTKAGGGPAEAAPRAVPENMQDHPGANLFGKHLPAYGFFVRLRFTTNDHRPAIACENVEGLSLRDVEARTLPGVEPSR